MTTRTQIVETKEERSYLVLHVKPRNLEEKSGNTLGGAGPVVTVPKPISADREVRLKSRLERKLIEAREQKIQSLLQKVRAASGWEEQANEWLEEFSSLEETQERAISLASFIVEVLKPLHLFDLAALAREILQTMLPEGELVEDFLIVCEVGLAKRKEYLEKCRRENTVAEAHFEACQSFQKKTRTQLERECRTLQGRMRALQAERRQITEEARVQIDSLIQKINALEAEVRAQVSAVQEQDLAESELQAIVSEYRTFLDGLK